MGGGNHCGYGAGRIIHRRVHERDKYFPGARAACRRERQHAKSSHHAVRAIHVRLRDRLIAAARRDHRGGGDGKEENLVASPEYRSGRARAAKLGTRNSGLIADMEAMLHITTLHYLVLGAALFLL